MSSGILEHAVDGTAFVEPLSTDQYHRMIETGILIEGAPIELIDGILVRKDRRDSSEASLVTVGTRHSGVITRLQRLLDRLVEPLGHHVCSQQPIHIPPQHEPEPDVAVVRGSLAAYDNQHPEPEDVLLVVEVADSSLKNDQETKLRVFALAGIGEYWIVNLKDACVEVYTGPTSDGVYQSRRVFQSGQAVPLEIDQQVFDIDVKAILPA